LFSPDAIKITRIIFLSLFLLSFPIVSIPASALDIYQSVLPDERQSSVTARTMNAHYSVNAAIKMSVYLMSEQHFPSLQYPVQQRKAIEDEVVSVGIMPMLIP
jgi:hypothetical protein